MNILVVSCREFPQPPKGEQLLLAALEELGNQITVLPWDDVKPTDKYDLVLIRTVWDYFNRLDEFMPWFESMEKSDLKCINSLSTIRWNIEKKYLLEIQREGIDIPTSFFWEGQYLPNWVQFEEVLGPPPYVFKPIISGGAKDTFLVQGDVSYSAAIDRLNKQPFIAQEYLREVKQGEVSALVFGGKFSHAVKKVPQSGDFRVQSQFGGSVQSFDMDANLVTWAEKVVSIAPDDPIVARVDFVLVDNKPILMELELFEPELFLETKPEAAMPLAKMMLRTFISDSGN